MGIIILGTDFASKLVYPNITVVFQGASQSMPWLAELVESSEGSLDILPVQCLCEFLLHDSPSDSTSRDLDDEDDRSERQKKRQVSLLFDTFHTYITS